MDEDQFFDGQRVAHAIHMAVAQAIARIGPAETRVSKSQVGFLRHHLFAATWMPRRYLKGDHAPLVLSVFLRRPHESPRWKEVVEPAPGRFTHHLELHSADEVDGFVEQALREAWDGAA